MSYISNIANSMLSHSGEPVLLAPEVYTAIAEWEKREIPASIVLSSIDEVYTQAAAEKKAEIPVEMFQDAVIRNFREWLSRTSGRHARAA